MGCYLSKLPRDSHGRIFRVSNVNDLGAEISPGKIEVTESDLTLYQRGKEPIRWPLRCLRRYGFDEELFSFESGRRCPTGSGIYAFKCLRAEELFNLVQEAIQNVGQHSHFRASQTHVNGGAPMSVTVRQNSRPTSVIDPRDPHEPSGIRLSQAGRVAVVPNDQHLYMNGTLPSSQREDSQPNYINTGGDTTDIGRDSQDQASALIDFLHNPPTTQAPPRPDTVNYADLDLPRSTENLFEECEGEAPALESQTSDPGPPSSQDGDNEEGLPGVGIEEVALNYADLDVFTDNPSEQPTYINVDAEGNMKETARAMSASAEASNVSKTSNMNGNVNKNLLVRQGSIEQNYTNIGAGSISFCPEPNPPVSLPVQVTNVNGITNRASVSGELNYIEIDVNKTDGEAANGATASAITTVTVPDSPSKRTESYAMIDFNRTVALSNSSKVVSDDGEGLRKTRHNSTIT